MQDLEKVPLEKASGRVSEKHLLEQPGGYLIVPRPYVVLETSSRR